jgi:hypothetical protein
VGACLLSRTMSAEFKKKKKQGETKETSSSNVFGCVLNRDEKENRVCAHTYMHTAAASESSSMGVPSSSDTSEWMYTLGKLPCGDFT